MTRVQAIFEKGVFRPVEPVRIDEGARVEITIEERTPVPSNPSINDSLDEIAKLPIEGENDGFSGADHDHVLYKST
jgi:predicted DNA-binding antitoxin AbrB/MazE fold protein